MTRDENERLAVVETEVRRIKTDVGEIKTDVRWLRDQVKAGTGAVSLIARIAPWAAVIVSVLSFAFTFHR